MNKIRLFVLLFISFVSISLMAQRERNYVYLLDCTKSMAGHNGSPLIWEPTKAYLRKELAKHTPGTTLHVIPFQGEVLHGWDFDAQDFNDGKWKDIEEKIDKYVENVTGTNICDAWDATDRVIDLHKDNYIILMTDGKDNKNGMDAVAKKLREWCGKYPNTYAFYVQLTKAAIDPKVAKVINICDNEYIIDATKGIPVFGSFENGVTIYANTLNLKKIHKVPFSSAGEYDVQLICDDPYFDVNVEGGKIKEGILPVKIAAKKSLTKINEELPQQYDFSFDVKSGSVEIINPKICVQMTNKPERMLETISEEADLGDASWYDSFLFWSASEPEQLDVDLKAVFNEEARKDHSEVVLLVTESEGNDDFQLLYNGQPVENGKFTLRSDNDKGSILSVVFHPNAEEGNHYFAIKTVIGSNIEKINDIPLKNYNMSLRAQYQVVWNPLKTILMWTLIIIVAALLLWFLIMKYIFYPSIKVKTIQINEPYFSKITVKGKRRVVFTNKPMKQGLWSRIFTGEILYKKHDVWTLPLVFEAGAKKKSLRVMRTKDYVFEPYTTMLKAPNDYVVENTQNNTKIKISIN